MNIFVDLGASMETIIKTVLQVVDLGLPDGLQIGMGIVIGVVAFLKTLQWIRW